jgi:hypothetical protein
MQHTKVQNPRNYTTKSDRSPCLEMATLRVQNKKYGEWHPNTHVKMPLVAFIMYIHASTIIPMEERSPKSHGSKSCKVPVAP